MLKRLLHDSWFSILLPAFVLLLVINPVLAQTTAFTYHGKLTDAGNLANGNYDMQFKLFDALSGGTQQGTIITNPTVQVTNGIFNVTLDFGTNVFTGAARFLEISLRPAGSPNPYTVLAPRQPITSSPYAIQTINAQQLGGLPASRYVATDAGGKVGIGLTTPTFRLHVVDSGNTGLRVQTNGVGGTLASFGGFGDFQIDAVNIVGGRLTVKESGNVGIGTAAPQAKLDVRGDVKLGGNGQFFAASGEENLRIVRGVAGGGGVIGPVTVIAGTGFTVSLINDGDYLIALDTPFSAMPAVVVTPDQYVNAEYATTYEVGTGSFKVHISNDSFRYFAFIAIGPR